MRRKGIGILRFGAWALLATLAVVALCCSLVLLNVWTYQRLTSEVDVAVLEFSQLGDKYFSATVQLPDGHRHYYRLRGDDWQLEARMIKWQPWFSLLGNDPLFRLERLRGRFEDVERARVERPSVYQLSENPGIDLWSLLRRHPGWLPALDAVYGSASYLPMSDGVRYRVTLGQSGLVARVLDQQPESPQSSY